MKNSYADLSADSVTMTNVLTRFLRMSQLTGSFVGNDADTATKQVSSAKLDVLSELIDSAENDGHKVVVIAQFLPEIHAIEKLLAKIGLHYSVIHGSVTDRPAQIEAFSERSCGVGVRGPDCHSGSGHCADGSLHHDLLLAGLFHE